MILNTYDIQDMIANGIQSVDAEEQLLHSHERLRFLLSALYRCKNGECWLSDDVMAEIEQAVKE